MHILFENLPESVILYSRQGSQVQMVNSEFKRLFKIQEQDSLQHIDSQVKTRHLSLFDNDSKKKNQGP